MKYAFLRARTVAWPDIAAVTSERVPEIRHSIPSLVVTYASGYAGPVVGQQLGETRSFVGNFTTASGDEMPIEVRDPDEVTHVGAVGLAPEGARAFNPAFDVTPAELVTAIITEHGVVRAPYLESLRRVISPAPSPSGTGLG